MCVCLWVCTVQAPTVQATCVVTSYTWSRCASCAAAFCGFVFIHTAIEILYVIYNVWWAQECPSLDEFLSELMFAPGGGAPAVITGAIDHWPALSRWKVTVRILPHASKCDCKTTCWRQVPSNVKLVGRSQSDPGDFACLIYTIY